MNYKRFWEVDFVRGTAILMMIVSNFVTDLDFFELYSPPVFWKYFARVTAFLFIFLVGISLTLSYSRNKKGFEKYVRRGMRIFTWGLLITIASIIFLGEGYILFGVLHLIGISIILAYPFLRYRHLSLFSGAVFILLGWFLQKFTFSFPWLFWLGFVPSKFYSLDYFPLLPWFGVVLLGVFLGNTLYPNYHRKFSLPELSSSLGKFLCLLGRNSLFIYFIHQPVLLGLIWSLR